MTVTLMMMSPSMFLVQLQADCPPILREFVPSSQLSKSRLTEYQFAYWVLINGPC